MRGSYWVDESNAPSTSSSHRRIHHQPPSCARHRGDNVFRLLARREICPRAKHASKKLWSECSDQQLDSFELRSESALDARRALISWVETESLLHLSAKYCPLSPLPRSTIAAGFSSDGKTLASTHGDHTVKIIDCRTGKCLKVLRGHRRTPWVVRFHPLCSEILASGSLDHEVRLWNANTADCIGSRDFYRPIASIAFHAHGELLAVASGHKLYIWQYNNRGETSSPAIVLKTRRSLRAVHFHPHGAPFLLTAEVNDLDSSDSSMTLATTPGYLHYHQPSVYLADAHRGTRLSLGDELPLAAWPTLIWPSFARDVARIPRQQTNGDVSSSRVQQRLDHSTPMQLLTYSISSGQYELRLSPIEPYSSSPVPEETQTNSFMDNEAPQFSMDTVETAEVQTVERNNSMLPSGDQLYWEVPFLHGWLAGQSQTGSHAMGSLNVLAHENLRAYGESENHISSPVIPINIGLSRGNERSDLHYRSSRPQTISATGSHETTAFDRVARSEIDALAVASRIQSELATSLSAAAAAELPCTVKLRIWPYDVKDPFAPFNAEQCRLTIPHAVLCSEMGAHFSPCGRFLAACVACLLPHPETDPGLQGQVLRDNAEAATSPTRHPISAHQVIYELRIYSLEEATFGLVLASRAIRAAHCLTSIQFSPTSEHLLLAYGRRHSSLLKSVVIDRETSVPIYTILEVYRVSDMELVRVLPSAEDEVNVACFHPSVGGGLVYGTKEGKLRILQYDTSHATKFTSSYLDEHMLEVPTYALEC
ncbi:uncharacterized protein LOC110611224 isoform X2 [Manihot esculenta]|uniref:Uncharacterized protein n=2 Tax=Manihot esculenta TaxID=3983 RepID=A0A2C9W7R8_MANES|nr:uncharacterized protein LOC110611224 isoform X2 [Manihot esculenta]OAY55461.1 hypothetical protein MANES_03G156000v8 [Manihot esculenta]